MSNMTMKQGMNWIRKEKRLAIYLRDGMACVYCGVGVEDEGTILSLDHLVCRSKGGDNHASNLVTCCHRCNSYRQDRPVEEFVKTVSEYTQAADADMILAHIENTRQRKLDVKAAKAIIAQRGWKQAVATGGK